MRTSFVAAVALGLLTAACGTNTQDRTTGGAAAGAATGAGVGALGGPVGALAGAAIGGGVGAVTGATTEPSTLNLGEPPWSNPDTRVPGVPNSGSRSAAYHADPRTRQLQQALNSRGFNAGPADGVWGPRTRSAVSDWQRANNETVTGTPSSQMLSQFNVTSSGNMAGTSSGSRGGNWNSGSSMSGSSSGMMGSSSGGSSQSQPLSRPNPQAPSATPAPSNSPMNDPIGGNANTGNLNNNQNTNR